MVVRSGIVLQNRPVVLRIPLPSSHSEEMLYVHRAESHFSRGWQRWSTQCGRLGCDRLERMYFQSPFQLPEKNLVHRIETRKDRQA